MTYFSLSINQFIYLMLAIIVWFLLLKYKSKICLFRVQFDAMSGLVFYETPLKKHEFVFLEMKLEKKQGMVSNGRSGYDATFFYLKEEKSKKKYPLGHFFKSQDEDLDFIILIHRVMKNKDINNVLGVIPNEKSYKRKDEFD